MVSDHCNGSISSTEFQIAAKSFSEKWKKFNSAFPEWLWIDCSNRDLSTVFDKDILVYFRVLRMVWHGQSQIFLQTWSFYDLNFLILQNWYNLSTIKSLSFIFILSLRAILASKSFYYPFELFWYHPPRKKEFTKWESH